LSLGCPAVVCTISHYSTRLLCPTSSWTPSLRHQGSDTEGHHWHLKHPIPLLSSQALVPLSCQNAGRPAVFIATGELPQSELLLVSLSMHQLGDRVVRNSCTSTTPSSHSNVCDETLARRSTYVILAPNISTCATTTRPRYFWIYS
jgi:hypothetical protein